MPFELAQAEGAALAAVGQRHAGVVDREVAHMQFVDRHVGLCGDARRGVLLPARRLQAAVVEIGDVAAPLNRRQADREYGSVTRLRTRPASRARTRRRRSGSTAIDARFARAPDARCRARSASLCASRAAPSPRSRTRTAARAGRSAPTALNCAVELFDAHAELALARRAGEHRIQRAGQLRGGGVLHAPGIVLLHQHELRGDQHTRAAAARRRAARPAARAGRDVLEARGELGRHAAREHLEVDRPVGAASPRRRARRRSGRAPSGRA